MQHNLRRLLSVPLFAWLATVVQAQVAPNTLTEAEKSAGYVQLFNGTDLSTWKTYRSNTPPPSWVVRKENDYNVIEVVAGGVGHLISKDSTFQNFDLKVEWKVPANGNSGIFIRYLQISDWGGESGPEAQVVDVAHSDSRQPEHKSGTCYDLFPLITGRDGWWNTTGNWNQFRIIAFNNRVVHYGNGKKLVEYDMTSNEYLDAYAGSKYARYPRYKEVHPGSIYLQHHGETGIKYRNLRIRNLGTQATNNPWQANSPYLKAGSTTQLVDDFTFDQNIMFGSTGAFSGFEPAGSAVRLTRVHDGLSILFPGRGDYAVRLFDARGSETDRRIVLDADRLLLPAGNAGARMLQVTSGDKTIHKGMIPAR